MTDRQLQIDALIQLSRKLKRDGSKAQAERLMRQTLVKVEEKEGTQSALTGLALLELADLFDEQGRDEEAGLLWNRIRKIMIEHSEAPNND
jgi:hypothetical protein